MSSGNKSLKSYGWNFGGMYLSRHKNLESLIEASCCRYAKVVTKSRLHEFLQQKCFFTDVPVKRHIHPDARVEQHQESN